MVLHQMDYVLFKTLQCHVGSSPWDERQFPQVLRRRDPAWTIDLKSRRVEIVESRARELHAAVLLAGLAAVAFASALVGRYLGLTVAVYGLQWAPASDASELLALLWSLLFAGAAVLVTHGRTIHTVLDLNRGTAVATSRLLGVRLIRHEFPLRLDRPVEFIHDRVCYTTLPPNFESSLHLSEAFYVRWPRGDSGALYVEFQSRGGLNGFADALRGAGVAVEMVREGDLRARFSGTSQGLTTATGRLPVQIVRGWSGFTVDVDMR